ncbi:hypothetical protein PoB_002461700 [Plakobranchus ocellatus]|uniref:Uncharacterized protein n=1 Tax=Plakobranchus ocellatus TaxID=259542 RepID=A0AAV3ZTW4_9GAST|nr:hypothetical protein PoB_002461700 [Plakobranchus ocellatus]
MRFFLGFFRRQVDHSRPSTAFPGSRPGDANVRILGDHAFSSPADGQRAPDVGTYDRGGEKGRMEHTTVIRDRYHSVGGRQRRNGRNAKDWSGDDRVVNKTAAGQPLPTARIDPPLGISDVTMVTETTNLAVTRGKRRWVNSFSDTVSGARVMQKSTKPGSGKTTNGWILRQQIDDRKNKLNGRVGTEIAPAIVPTVVRSSETEPDPFAGIISKQVLSKATLISLNTSQVVLTEDERISLHTDLHSKLMAPQTTLDETSISPNTVLDSPSSPSSTLKSAQVILRSLSALNTPVISSQTKKVAEIATKIFFKSLKHDIITKSRKFISTCSFEYTPYFLVLEPSGVTVAPKSQVMSLSGVTPLTTELASPASSFSSLAPPTSTLFMCMLYGHALHHV